MSSACQVGELPARWVHWMPVAVAQKYPCKKIKTSLQERFLITAGERS